MTTIMARRRTGRISLARSHPFLLFLGLIGFTCLLAFWFLTFVFLLQEKKDNLKSSLSSGEAAVFSPNSINLRHPQQASEAPEEHASPLSQAHLVPKLPYLPPFVQPENADNLMKETYAGNPTIAGIAAVLQHFLDELHKSNLRLVAKQSADAGEIRAAYFHLTKQILVPLDEPYRGRSVFPIREDDSVFLSLAAFREHLLGETMKSAFDNAAHPDKLFIGAVVQNCFGIGDEICKTGVQDYVDETTGEKHHGMKDGPPDKNGIDEFCNDQQYQHYCESGQVRVVYMNETDALGPAAARYYASKLWGGETYFVQSDAHLHFAQQWDALYIEDIKLARSFPKAVFSTYPPGFVNFRQEPPYTRGTKLCKCWFPGGEGDMIRVEMDGRCQENQTRPTQSAFIGAGFFLARAEFLVDNPFDPFLGWLFTGEEIALSIRAWTSGWDIYAPRKNLIGHQYRPLKKYPGLPHHYEAVTRLFGKPLLYDRINAKILNRIKHMIGYPAVTREALQRDIPAFAGHHAQHADEEHFEEQDYDVLLELEHYGLGNTRHAEEYLKHVNIDMDKAVCNPIPWCAASDLE